MKSRIRLNVLFKTLAVMFLLLTASACQKVSESISNLSPENSFLSSLNARWNDANNASIMVSASEGKIVVIDANGEMYLLTPSGKFDADKKAMPVNMAIIPKVEGAQDVVAETLVRYLPATFKNSSGAQKACTDTSVADLSTKFSFKNIFSSTHVSCMRNFASKEGMTALKQVIAPAVPGLKTENVMQNLILYNASTDPKSFKLGLKRTGGDIIWNLGFARKLNDDELKQLTAFSNNPQQNIVARNAIIDKTVADILSYIEGSTERTHHE